MKRFIKASKVDTFLKYHDDENNWRTNRNGFERMYNILNKYDDSNGNDTVDVAFNKATPEEQDKMIALITPKVKRVGEKGYAKQILHQAWERDFGDNTNIHYCEGVEDAFAALFAEGLLDEDDFVE